MTPGGSTQNLNAKLTPRPDRRSGSPGLSSTSTHRTSVHGSDRPARVSGTESHYHGGYCISV